MLKIPLTAILYLCIIPWHLPAQTITDSDSLINLSRLSITSYNGGISNGDRSPDNRFYGVKNLFDAGTNEINGITYDYWLSAGQDDNWVRLNFRVPVTIHRIVIEVDTAFYLPHPDHYQLYLYSHNSKNPVYLSGGELDNSHNLKILDSPVANITSAGFTFFTSDAISLKEIKIIGTTSGVVDFTPVMPEYDRNIAPLKNDREFETKSDKLHISSAFPDGNFITFDSPFSIDWKSLAPEKFIGLEKGNKDSLKLGLIKNYQNMFGYVPLEFNSPLPDKIKSQACYLISPSGIEKLNLLNLKGTVRYRVDNDNKSLTSPSYYGSVTAKIISETAGMKGGFVICSENSLNFNRYSQDFNKKRFIEAISPDMSISEYKKYSEAGFFDLNSNYFFSISSRTDPFLFVSLEPDSQCLEGCCSHRYYLLKMDNDLHLVSTNLFGCDI